MSEEKTYFRGILKGQGKVLFKTGPLDNAYTARREVEAAVELYWPEVSPEERRMLPESRIRKLKE